MNPFIENKKLLSIYFIAWIFIAIAHSIALIPFFNNNSILPLTESIVFNFLYSIIGLSFWYTVKFIPFQKNKFFLVFLHHAAAATLIISLWLLLSYNFIKYSFGLSELEHQMLFNSLTFWGGVGILYYIIIVIFNYAIIYRTDLEQKQNRENELKALLKETELKSLKYQINPHFIFNSLNSISSLTLTDPNLANEMTIKLSSFFRNKLAKKEKHFIKFSEELENIVLYIDIEKVRFEDKLIFEKNICEDCLNFKVPNLLLQPLFENAIKYGVYESLEPVKVILNCKVSDEYMKIEIRNSFDPESVPQKGEGIGLKNIKERLKLLYNQDNLLTTRVENNNFIVSIFIPKNDE